MTVLILHGTWSPGGEAGEGHRDGHFFAWAERVPAGRRGRRPAAGPRDGAPHPFQARPEETRDAVVTLSPTLARQVDRGTWRLVREWIRLPSRGESPIHSPEAARAVAALGDGGSPSELGRDRDRDGPLLLGTWQVRGVALEAVRAVQLLADLPGDGRMATNSVVLGSDIRFWSAVAKLVVELLARQRVVPTLDQYAGEYEAGWRPVMDDPRDVERLAWLVQAMPPAARALRGSNGQDEPRARPLVESFLSTAVDGLARTWLSATTSRRLTPSPPPSAGRAWLEALRRGDRLVRASTRDLDHISTRLAEWRAPLVTAGSSSPYRTCFQLEPPAPPAEQAAATVGTPWMLRFFLQATDDPGLLLPAEQVWQEPASTLVYRNRRFDQPQERLLADLGRAAQAFPALDAALARPQPSACELTPEDAYAFLRETAWLLEEEGFGVLVPSWWDRRGPRGRLGLRLKLHPPQDRNRTDGLLGGRSIVEYDWRLAVGDVELSEAEFRQLAALKVPLVCVRGQWVELRPDKIEQAITFWEKQRQTVQIATSAALSLALGTDEVEGLPVLGVTADGWVANLLGRLDEARQIEPLVAPAGFHGELRPYQERGAGWLRFLSECGLGACLADDMGLGKTVQYIAFLLQRRSQPPPRRPALLVCPTSVVGNWRHELARFAPSLRVMVHHGTGRLSRADLAAAALQHDLVVTSYALVHRDLDALSSVTWDGVVLDEAQNVKNPSTLQARAVRSLAASYRFALTGTPLENRLTELWSIIDFLNPGYLGTPGTFRQRFVTPIERWQDAERAEQLKELVQPLLLRRLKTDPAIIQDLPEKLEGNVYCTLTAEQASLYQAVVSEMLAQVEATEGIQRRGLVLATLTRLKQVCNHPAHLLADNSPLPGRSGKLDRLEEMLEEVLAAGDCALVFTQFAEFGSRLREELQSHFGREVIFLHGGVPALQRDEMVRRFQQDADGPPIFVLSLRAGGVGLNLTRASHVFHFDRWWNPAVENQATDRAFRIGQQRNVQVHKFVCAGTLEEKIDALIESKRALAEQVVGAGEAWLTELSTGELRDLLTLRGEAVVE